MKLQKILINLLRVALFIHPAIDAAIQLRNRYKIQPEQIKSIVFKGNPMVLELTGKKEPKTGLEGKFSVYHSSCCSDFER
jgi:2-methylcitrate dehydratase PrpD